MITTQNLQDLLRSIGYSKQSNSSRDVWQKNFSLSNSQIVVDFEHQKINYPKELKIHRETTTNFSSNENFVVLECITRLLSLGYKPHHLELEKGMPGGHSDTGGYCDIIIQDNDGNEFLLIECKTEGKEFQDAWHRMLQDGGQLFNYFNSYRKAKALCLYTSDYEMGDDDTGHCSYTSYIVSMIDNVDYLKTDDKLRGYGDVARELGGKGEYFAVWRDTYDCDYRTVGIFEQGAQTFELGTNILSVADLREADEKEIQKKYHEYATIMRQHNVSGRENAFDKLVNLFLVKIVDETIHKKNLQFYWRGAAEDDYYSLQDRLQQMYSYGMKEFLTEEVTYIDNKTIENTFYLFKNDPDATKEKILDYFQQLKFYTNSDFAFLDVHNKELFRQNAEILKKVVKMLEGLRLRTTTQNQFLGDLFEGFLDQGVKQSEGQFFTPMPIVRFLISSLPLEAIIEAEGGDKIPKVIDYACGAGHFLTEYAQQVKSLVETHGGNPKPYYDEIYGVEKEYRLSKVAKVSAFMYGQEGINIIYQDALLPHPDLQEETFSLLVANPPYSVKGFLDVLTEEERRAYRLSQYVSDSSANNSIETFFIERSSQLLKPGGRAVIILPSSVLSNGNIYTKTREIILEEFDLRAIVEFPSGTFGKTGTNTIALYLEKKSSSVPLAQHYRYRVKAWFEGENGDRDKLFEDDGLLTDYCSMLGVERSLYATLLCGKPDKELWSHSLFKAYREQYQSDSKANSIRKKRITQRYTQEDRERELEQYIVGATRDIEQEKLYYYLLSRSNSQPVLIVKSPVKTADIKQFLGYEWSTRKGSEGIKYIDSIAPSEDDLDLKGIAGIQTPLFNPRDLFDSDYINSLIRSHLLGTDYTIPSKLQDYCFTTPMEEMIDFTPVKWEMALSTSMPNHLDTHVLTSSYPSVPLDSILTPIEGAVTKVPRKSIQPSGTYPVITQENSSLIAGYVDDVPPITDIPIILFGDHTCTFKYIDKPFVRGADGTQLIKVDELQALHKYVYQYLLTIEIKNANLYERHYKYLKRTPIPLPPLSVQEQIVAECDAVDTECEEARKQIEISKAKIAQLFKDLGEQSFQNIRVGDICSFVSQKIGIQDIDSTHYITTDNLLQDKRGCIPFEGIPNIDRVTAYQEGDVLVSNIRPYLKKIWLANRRGGCSNDVLVFRLNDGVDLSSQFFYYSLSQDAFFDYVMQGVKGVKMPRGNKTHIMQYTLPIPPLEEQERIVAMTTGYEAEIVEAEELIAGCAERKKAILESYLE